MTKPPVYHPLPEKPWPNTEGWVVVWWHEEEGQWVPGAVRADKQEALDWIAKRRQQDPDFPIRLVKETRSYTAEED